MKFPNNDAPFFISEEQIEEIIEKLASEDPPDQPKAIERFYADRIAVYKMIFSNVTSLKLPDKEVIAFWKNIITHKYLLSEKIGRNIGFRVAALDYFYNIKNAIEKPMLIENEKYEKMVHETKTDFKTNLFNTRALYHAIDHEIDRAKRYGLFFSVLLFDFDDFKLLNDTLGHIKGDILLSHFSSQLKKCLRKIDLPARFGGDEFCVLFPQTGKNTALKAALRIQKKLTETCKELFPEFRSLSISGGIATYPINGASKKQLLANADKALFEAKQNGKDQIRLCSHSDKALKSTARLVSENLKKILS